MRRLPSLIGLAMLAELFVLIVVGSVLGALTTILLVVLTSMFGASLLRGNGLRQLQEAQQQMAGQSIPPNLMFRGVYHALAGMLLLLPGFMTDLIGLVLLIPAIQRMLMRYLLGRFQPANAQWKTDAQHNGTWQSHSSSNVEHSHEGEVFEGEYERKDRDS